MKDVEILAPAGDLEKLKIAIEYGADAVYIGGELFGLRASAKNFTLDEMKEGVDYAHEKGVRVFLTLNIIPHNEDLINIEEYLISIDKIGIDAVIVADLGMFSIVKRTIPNMEIHISTQANNTNYESVKMWNDLGAKRVVLARELSLREIKEISDKTKSQVELEVFIHGAMCISYSGRCLLSNYLVDRDANRGACAQPCRWNYYLVEERRPGEYFPIVEDGRATYFMNSKDLCMIENIKEMMDLGVKSFKIEGRMKSIYYIATVVNAYRMAIDEYKKDPENYTFNEELLNDIKKVSNREFTKGFYFDKPDEEEHIYKDESYIREFLFVAIVLKKVNESGYIKIQQRNRFFKDDIVEVFGPKTKARKYKIKDILNEDNISIDVAPHPKEELDILLEPLDGDDKFLIDENYMIRKSKD